MQQGVSFLIHGHSKTGKSTLSDTSPAPRLVLDAEGGASTRFTKSRKVQWNPMMEAPPAPDGTWETAVVHVRSFQDVQRAYDWLNSGQHHFKSVSVDSLSETQQRCVDAIAGTEAMRTQDWGELLRKMSSLVRQYRDLIIHPTNPLEVVTFIAMTRDYEGTKRPYVQGALASTLPYYVDVCGYMWTEADATSGEIRHRLLCGQVGPFEAGDRTGKLGTVVENPNIMEMLAKIYAD